MDKRLELKELKYKELIAYKECMMGFNPLTTLRYYGVSCGGEAAALFALEDYKNSITVRWIFVKNKYRRQKIASTFMEKLASALKNTSYSLALLDFQADTEDSHALKCLCLKQDFELRYETLVSYEISLDRVKEAFEKEKMHTVKGYEIMSLEDFSGIEFKKLLANAESRKDYLLSRISYMDLDKSSSFVMKNNGVTGLFLSRREKEKEIELSLLTFDGSNPAAVLYMLRQVLEELMENGIETIRFHCINPVSERMGRYFLGDAGRMCRSYYHAVKPLM